MGAVWSPDCSASDLLLPVYLRKQQKMAQVLGSLQPCKRPGLILTIAALWGEVEGGRWCLKELMEVPVFLCISSSLPFK